MESNTELIPFADLKRQYLSIQHEVDRALKTVLSETAFIGGRNNRFVNSFESEYSEWLGVPHTIGVANGTDALEIILQAWGIGPGDEVIVPALTWFSTVEAVLTLGAKPIFTDIIPGINTMATDQLENLVSQNTKAIIPVHLYGQMARMEEIMEFANRHSIKVLEDCAQSHGAERLGRKAGTWGHAAAFSFYPGKNLGAYGDAGAICTSDPELEEVCRQIANHGQKKKHEHMRNGRNSRLDGIQAAILSLKLPLLDAWNQTRISIGNYYTEKLKNLPITLPITDLHNKHVFHLYVIHHTQRDNMALHLKKNNIETALHYPYPIPDLIPLQGLVTNEIQYPNTKIACNTLLSIPMFPELSPIELEQVCHALSNYPFE